MSFENLKVGLKNFVESKVSEEDTALAVGSGSLKVFATPKMLALMEKAAADLAEKNLPEEFTSVGIFLEVKHVAPTPIGLKVRAEAELIAVEERKLVFKVSASDEREEIGRGTHERFVVKREKFQAKADSKREK